MSPEGRLDENPPTEGGEHPSLAIPQLLRDLGGGGGWRILDLGRSSGATVRFFSRYGCRLHFADLYRSLKRATRDDVRRQDFAAECARLLELPGPPIDVILAWDLLSYLAPDEIAGLVGAIADRCQRGTVLYCLISIRPKIAAEPFAFSLLAADTVLYEPTSPHLRPGPRYKEPQLVRAMPGFSPQRAFLLRNGMQEYLFERQLGPVIGHATHRRSSPTGDLPASSGRAAKTLSSSPRR